jgi:hypothetical protein
VRRTASLTAERAVRYLRDRPEGATGVALAGEVLSARVNDEATAARILESAFASDPRLAYDGACWRLSEPAGPVEDAVPAPEPDLAFVVIEGDRPEPRRPFTMRTIAIVRAGSGRVLAACAGDPGDVRCAAELRGESLAALDGATAVVHDAPGAIEALEQWLGEPLGPLVSLRRLGRLRAGLPVRHTLEELAARLGQGFREAADPVRSAEILESCLRALRRPGETIAQLEAASAPGAPPIPWARYAFDRAWLRTVPSVAGTYRFLDAEGGLLYVGRSRDLRRRLASYFRESGPRTRRVQRLIDAIHRIEIAPSGSDLDAVLREAAEIARRRPVANVQRHHHPTSGRGARFESILILESAWPPHALRAFLIHGGEWVDVVPIGPRGGGLRRIERLLDERCFDPRPGPTSRPTRPIEVELITRWLAAHRDRAVAFDPTHLRSAREVVERLRWFLGAGSLGEGDAGPWVPR